MVENKYFLMAVIAFILIPFVSISRNKINTVELSYGDAFFNTPYTADSLTVLGEYVENDLFYSMKIHSKAEKPLLQVKFLDISNSIIINENYDEGEYVIDNYAFKDCGMLEHIVFPKNITILGSHLFENCFSLHTVVLPDSLKEIRPMAFVNCPLLKKIKISSSNKHYATYENSLYDKNKRLLYLVPPTVDGDYDLSPNVEYIECAAFYKCDKLNSFKSNDILKCIGNFAFYGCSNLSSVEISSSVQKIGNFVFFKCGSLKEIILPKNLRDFGIFAFAGCEGLETVYVESEQVNNNCLFAGCPNLKSFVVNETNRYFSSKDGVLFDKSGKVLVAYPNAKGSDYEVPESVKKIGRCSFYDCKDLISVTFPSGVLVFENAALSNCKQLKFVKILAVNPPSVQESSFAMVDKHKCILSVPNSSLNLYKNHPVWGAFDNIVGF